MAKKKSATESPAGEATATGATATGAAVVVAAKPRKFQVFDRLIVKRSTLRFHEQNPRSIDPHAFKKLRDFVRKRGLLGAVQANRRLASNGFEPSQHNQLVLIGGHQRIRAMDDIAGFSTANPASTPHADYDVPVDVDELSPAHERECLIALNNAGMMGNYDYDILSELITFPGVDPLAVGFDKPELAAFIDAGILEQLIGAPAAAQAAAEAPVFSDLAAITESGREADAALRAAEKGAAERTGTTVQTIVSVPGQAGDAAVQSATLTPEQIQQQAVDGMKARRQEYQQTVNSDVNAANFMLCLVADTDEQLAEFLTQLSLDPTTEFLPLSQFKDAVTEAIAGGSFDVGAFP